MLQAVRAPQRPQRLLVHCGAQWHRKERTGEFASSHLRRPSAVRPDHAPGLLAQGEAIAFALGGSRKMLRASSLASLIHEDVLKARGSAKVSQQ